MKRYKVCYNEWKPFQNAANKEIRTDVDHSSNRRDEALKYISDVCSEKGFGKPAFVKIGRDLYAWRVDSLNDFTANFNPNEDESN